MAFREFTFPEVFDRLNLKLSQAGCSPRAYHRLRSRRSS